MEFSIRVDDVKHRGDVITIRRWVCPKKGFRRDKFLNMENRKKKEAKAYYKDGFSSYILGS